MLRPFETFAKKEIIEAISSYSIAMHRIPCTANSGMADKIEVSNNDFANSQLTLPDK